MQAIKVALIGGRSDAVIAHAAIPTALQLAAQALTRTVLWDWAPTELLQSSEARVLEQYDCAWCVPGSPYRSEGGALEGIRVARESGMPFLGTCGGCQHAILEYVRNELGLGDAQHAESHPDALLPLIAPLSCALVETTAAVFLEEGSMVREIYGRARVEEGYHCSYGLNPALEHLLAGSMMKITGRDSGGEARVLELGGREFYLLTQFQPERGALDGTVPPIVAAFVAAAARAADDGEGTQTA